MAGVRAELDLSYRGSVFAQLTVVQWTRLDTSAASSARCVTLSLLKMLETCDFAVAREISRRSAIWTLVRPRATRPATTSSVGVRLSQPAAGRLRKPRPRRV